MAPGGRLRHTKVMIVGRRWLRGAVGALLALGVLATTRLARAGDPRLEWFTIEAGRFRVHYHGGLEGTAQRVAHLATQIEDEVIKIVGARPIQSTEILLADSADSANGFSSVLPYSAVVLFVTSPDDMSGLGEYDDWLSTLISHEDTHIVHMGSISGLPALVNAIVGKQAVPNQLQPRWLIEGLAVYAETKLSGGGRLRSPAFDMMFRADVLDDNFATLDQISASPFRWPIGIYYLYGAKFVEFLANLYGPSVFAAAVQDTADDVMPFAVSRPFYRATGRTIEELYSAFRDSAQRRVSEQMEVVLARGLREGRPLTAHGRSVSSPRLIPARCRRAGAKGGGTANEDALVYFRDDGHERPGYYELLPDAGGTAALGVETLITRAAGENAAIGPDCSLWFESVAPSQRRYYFYDLFRQQPGTVSPSGVEDSRERVTVGRRATDPDVAKDGTHIVYVTNRGGTTTLRIASLDANGKLSCERALVPSATHEQVYTPRFSPDGTQVVYGVWTRGGYRDLRIVSLTTGQVYQPWKDRAIDQQPQFSPDGKWLYFSSDRSGISNVYVYDLERAKMWQVTNVRTGAFMPELSADGQTLYYVGYSSRGYDLYSMPIQQQAFLEPPTKTIERDDRVILNDRGTLPAHSYSPLSTLHPRALGFDYQNDNSGQRLVLSTTGSDIVGHHSLSATAYFKPEGQSPDVYLEYGYWRLPVGLFVNGYRRVAPSHYYNYGAYHSSVDMVRTGVTTGAILPLPREFEEQTVSLAYAAEDVDAVLPTGLAADPYATVPREPRRGIVSMLRLTYSFGNTEGSTYGVGAERGVGLLMSLEEAHRSLGSELEGTNAYGRLRGYLLMPWLRHHVLALSGTAAASTGSAGRGYWIGGHQESDLLRGLLERTGQDRAPLRGYPVDRFGGRRLLLGQAEYRFPLYVVDRGVSTLPVFMRRIGGALGFDAGGAFDGFDPHDFGKSIHYGFSGELWFDFTIAYRTGMHFILGYAAGMGVGAYEGGTSYLIWGSPL